MTKQCNTGTRVFKTFLYLCHNDASIQDIVNYFTDNEKDSNYYTNEAILKYINTLKLFGIEIVRNKDTYSILSYPPYISLNEKEITGLKIIDDIEFPENKTKQIFHEFICELDKKLTPNTKHRISAINNCNSIKSKNKEKEDLINSLERYIQRDFNLKILLKDKKELIAKPLEIINKNNKIFYSVYISKKSKIYYVDITKIDKITELNSYGTKIMPLQETIFKLKGNLAKTYKLKEGEYITEKEENGDIIVVNSKEPENLLLKRLLRYDYLCEIISPSETKEKIKRTLDNMLKLYEE